MLKCKLNEYCAGASEMVLEAMEIVVALEPFYFMWKIFLFVLSSK